MPLLLFLFASSLLAETAEPCNAGLDSYRGGDYANAQQLLWSCIESGRGQDIHALYLAQTYRTLKNCEAGMRRAAAAMKKLPGNQNLLYVGGYVTYRCNHTKESMLLTNQAYRLSPKDWRVHQLFALNYISFDMMEAAKLSLKTAISLDSNNPELYYQLARLYFSLGSFVDSIELSKKALALLPDYPEAVHNLALSYEGSGNVALAMENFQKAVDLNRKYHRADEWPLIDFAVYQRMGGNPEASVPLLREALQINPKSAKANYEMGELLRDLRKYGDAKTYLERAIELDPCNARALYGLAIVTRQLGDIALSKIMFQRFKEADRKERDQPANGKVCEAQPAQPH